jgi:glucosamine-6-phosphate deaminase
MEVVITRSPGEVAELAAGIIRRTLEERVEPVIGLATGSSPIPTYRRLIEMHRDDGVSFANVHAVMLDEYVGLPAEHPQSYRAVIRRDLVDHVDLPIERLHGPDVTADDVTAACRHYDEAVTSLGVDVQLLGIGSDGHIGFNEPGSSLGSRTRIKTLTDETRRDNARFFGSVDDVPRHVVTQGLATISAASHLVLIATGAVKADPIARAVEGPVTATCPASVLQFHPHVTVLLDDAAAGRLTRAGYYRSTYQHKPPWQAL